MKFGEFSRRSIGTGAFGTFRGGSPTPTPSTPLAPTYYDAFDYTDGTRLVAGDPNANAGQVATNPGNLGWTALTTGAADNSRFNLIVYQGKVTTRTTSNFGANTYLLTPNVALSGWQTVKGVVLPLSGQQSGFALRGSNQANRLHIRNNNAASIGINQVIGGTLTAVTGSTGGSTSRKIGGNGSGTMRLFNDADETITAITYNDGANWRIVLRRKGTPIGNPVGETFTDPAGAYFGFGVDVPYRANEVSMLQASQPATVLFLTETFNAWYPKVKAAAGDAINTGSATITFPFTFVGTAPARLEWCLKHPTTGAIIKDWDWVPLAGQVIGSGTGSATVAVPVGLAGRMAYCFGLRVVNASNQHDEDSEVVSVKHFYVALNVALIGQSNSGGLTNTMTGAYPDHPGSATYQKADPVGLASTNSAGYAIGATTITLASSGTGLIAAGEYVQFAGDGNSYLVATGDADVSNGGSIVIAAPGLLQAIPASNTAITRSGSRGTYVENTGYWTSTVEQTGGKGTARLGDILSTQLNIPVCFEVMAIGARGAQALGPSGADWFYIQTHHAFAGGAFEIIYLSQGENETVAGGSSWLTRWVDENLPAYLAMSGQPSDTVIPIFQAWTGRGPGSGTATLASTKALREGQDAFVAYANAQLANIIALPGNHYVGVKMSDGAHYTNIYGEGYDEVSRRLALSVMKHLGASAYDGMGPIATTATRAAAVITIDFDLNGATSMTCRNGEDQSLTATATALTSWEVSANDFASNLTISSAELIGNQVVLTLSADPGGPVKVRNHYGFQPTVTSWAFGAYADGSYIGSKPIITPLVSN